MNDRKTIAGPPLELVSRAVLDGLENARIGLIVAAFEAEVPRRIFVSEAAAVILGYSVHELLSMGPEDTIAPEDRDAIRAMVREAHQMAAPPPRVLACIQKSGRVVRVRIVPSVAELGGVRVVLVFYSDVTEKIEMADALERSELRLRAIMDSAPDPIGIQGPTGLAVYVNPAMVRTLGLSSADQVVGQSALAFIHPDDHATLLKRQRELSDGGHARGAHEYRLLRADGGSVEAEFYSIPIEIDGGPAFLTFAHDITERKRFEQRMVRADRLAALGQLAAGVAHEINNPLAFARLNVERLAEIMGDLGAQDTSVARDAALEQFDDALGTVLTGLDRVASIARDLRAFARDGPDDLAEVELADVATRAVAIVANQVRHRGRLIVDAAPVAATVLGNAMRLEQVVMNLLVNAVQALPVDSVQSNEIRLTIRSEDHGAIIEVADNGPGIPESVAARIFEPFFTTKGAGEGTGLGLAICERIVMSYGGRIELVSPSRGGATFRVWLPASSSPDRAGAPRAAPTETVAVPTDPSRLRILVIDDEVAIVNVLKIVLSDHDVETCTDGTAARERLLAEEWDVVLCDMMMPGVTGIELWEDLALARPGREERIVFITGGAIDARGRELLRRTENVVLEKPFGIAAVRAAVARHRRSETPAAS